MRVDPPKKAIINGLGVYIPEPRQSAVEIASLTGIPEAVVIEKMGLRCKPVAGPDDHPVSMGVKAAQRALAASNMNPESVDVVICFTEEHKDYPLQCAGVATAHLLGAHRAWAYDVGQKCGAAVLALKQARDLLIADKSVNVVLITGGYRNGDLVDYADASTRFLFSLSAGAAAAVITREGLGFELLESTFRVDGSFSDDIRVPVGGTRSPFNPENLHDYRLRVRDYDDLKRRLQPVSMRQFEFVVRESVRLSGYSMEEVDYLALPHMKRNAHHHVLSILGIDFDKSNYLDEHGHMGQIDPLLSLSIAKERGQIQHGAIVVLAGAGIGYVWNAISCRYHSH